MTQVQLYQSVLQKLGQVSAENLALLDKFLATLIQPKPLKKQDARQVVLSLSGAWKDWDDKKMEAFLEETTKTRYSLFADRTIEL